MFREYVCKFSKDGNTQELVFEIFKNSVTEQWTSVVEKYINEGLCEPDGIQRIFPKSINFLNQQFADIANSVRKLNELGNWNLGWPRDASLVSQEHLNQLHQDMQFCIEQLEDQSPALAAFNKLNHEIHAYESADTKRQGDIAYAVWYCKYPSKHTVKIEDHVRPNWANSQQTRPAGALTLGYATVGKSIYDAAKNNDVELVKQNGIRPQEYITSEVVLTATPVKIVPDHVMYGYIRKWVEANNLSSYIDLEDAKHRWFRQPQIGKLKSEHSYSELEELFMTWKFDKIEIG